MFENDKPQVDEGDFTEPIDASKLGKTSQSLRNYLRKLFIGQDAIIDRMVAAIIPRLIGLEDSGGPLFVGFLAGPTGSGKTALARAVATWVIGDAKPPWTLVEGKDLKEKWSFSRLEGSAPGLIGSDEVPKLAQIRIDWPHVTVRFDAHMAKRTLEAKDGPISRSKKRAIRMNKFEAMQQFYFGHAGEFNSVIVIDEAEKIHRDNMQAFLRMIDTDHPALNMSDGSETSFKRALIIFTSNIGARDMSQVRIGFGAKRGQDWQVGDQELQRGTNAAVMNAMGKLFSPELMGRLDNQIYVFRALRLEELGIIFDQQCVQVQTYFQKQLSHKIADGERTLVRIKITFSSSFRDWFMSQVNVKSGARGVINAMKSRVWAPMSQAIESQEIQPGDEVLVTVELNRPVLKRKPRPVAVPKVILNT